MCVCVYVYVCMIYDPVRPLHTQAEQEYDEHCAKIKDTLLALKRDLAPIAAEAPKVQDILSSKLFSLVCHHLCVSCVSDVPSSLVDASIVYPFACLELTPLFIPTTPPYSMLPELSSDHKPSNKPRLVALQAELDELLKYDPPTHTHTHKHTHTLSH